MDLEYECIDKFYMNCYWYVNNKNMVMMRNIGNMCGEFVLMEMLHRNGALSLKL